MLLDDDDVIEGQEGTNGQEQSTQQDEPVTSLPEHAGGEQPQTRESLREAALAEGAEEGLLTELAAKEGELTVDDLRKLPGAEGLSDEQLMAEWKKVSAQAAGGGGVTAQATDQTFKLPFPVYDDKGDKIEALEKISLRDLFDGKVKLGYTAMGKEQQKTLAEALRNASLGHWNESKYNTTLSERDQLAKQVSEQVTKVQQFEAQQKTWDAALSALAMGNPEPMRQLAQAYTKALSTVPQATPGMVPIAQVQQERELEQRGQQVLQNVIEPRIAELVSQYPGANAQELRKAVEFYVTREAQFMTPEKLQNILTYELPALLETHGYKAGAAPATSAPAADTGKLAELERTVQALQAKIASGANATTQAARDKGKKTPPAGSGTVPSAGDSQPSFKSRSQMKAYLNGDPEWAKA